MKKYKYKQKYVYDIKHKEEYTLETVGDRRNCDDFHEIATTCILVEAMNKGTIPDTIFSFQPWDIHSEHCDNLLEDYRYHLAIVREEVENSHDIYVTTKEPV